MTGIDNSTWLGCRRVVELMIQLLAAEVRPPAVKIHRTLTDRAGSTDPHQHQTLERTLSRSAAELLPEGLTTRNRAVDAVVSAASGDIRNARALAELAVADHPALHAELLRLDLARPEHVTAVMAATQHGIHCRNQTFRLVRAVERTERPSWPSWLLAVIPTLVEQAGRRQQHVTRRTLDALARTRFTTRQAEVWGCLLRDGTTIQDGVRLARLV
jgi:replication-associated recombination protein RarA